MSGFKKKSQSMIDEISENLKRTIKKYNEIDIENDLSVIQSVENEDSKSNQYDGTKYQGYEKNYGNNNYTSNEGKLSSSPNNANNLIYQTKKVIENSTNQLRDSNMSMSGAIVIGQSTNQMNQIYPPSQLQKHNNQNISNKILNSLNELDEAINKDFSEIEGLIDSVVEKELKYFYK
jgi:hypothetical protein